MNDVKANGSDHTIRTQEGLREILGQSEGLAVTKSLKRLDRYCKQYLSLSPFLLIGTSNAQGKADVSPRGDASGFVQVLDDTTIAIPDRPGNNRADTMVNILQNPNVGLILLVPGFDDTLRINGKATITTDPAILKRMVVQGKEPKLAIKIKVEEAFLHCAKAFRRSRLWETDAKLPREIMPSLARMILEQTGSKSDEKTVAEADEYIEENYRTDLW